MNLTSAAVDVSSNNYFFHPNIGHILKTLVLDIETKPLILSSWGLFDQHHNINQIIEHGGILCVAAKWLGSKEKFFFAEWEDYGHAGMINAIYELVDEAEAIITYNGRSFDMKHLKAEFVLAGLTPPSPHKDIDLLLVARKHFKLASRKLDYVAQALGLGAKVSHPGQALWNECIRPTDEKSGAKARKLMRKYNLGDIELTEALYFRIQGWIDNGSNVALYADDDQLRCTSCGSEKVHKRGWAYTNACRYRRFHCQVCGRWMRSRTMESTTELRPA